MQDTSVIEDGSQMLDAMWAEHGENKVPDNKNPKRNVLPQDKPATKRTSETTTRVKRRSDGDLTASPTKQVIYSNPY